MHWRLKKDPVSLHYIILQRPSGASGKVSEAQSNYLSATWPGKKGSPEHLWPSVSEGPEAAQSLVASAAPAVQHPPLNGPVRARIEKHRQSSVYVSIIICPSFHQFQVAGMKARLLFSLPRPLHLTECSKARWDMESQEHALVLPWI